jgi:hypothetical protein
VVGRSRRQPQPRTSLLDAGANRLAQPLSDRGPDAITDSLDDALTDGFTEGRPGSRWWRWEELNLRHGAYETPALPLSYTAVAGECARVAEGDFTVTGITTPVVVGAGDGTA